MVYAYHEYLNTDLAGMYKTSTSRGCVGLDVAAMYHPKPREAILGKSQLYCSDIKLRKMNEPLTDV